MGQLDGGVTVEATGEAAVAADGGIWRLVGSDGLGKGWVNEAFLAFPRSSEEALVDAFVAFAQRPSDASFAELPLADVVELGLGSETVIATPASSLRDVSTWELDVEFFRSYEGPFSALEMLEGLGVYDVTVGPHPHCASPPIPPPSGLEDLTRVSVQPRLGLASSCLMWGTVDLFVTADGVVEAIALDLWEP